MKSDSHSNHIGLSSLSNKRSHISKYYDDWASDYNGTLAGW
jgi:hypothetical protein